MAEPAFRDWLARKSWDQVVRYCLVALVLLPAGAFVLHNPWFGQTWPADRLAWILGWELAAGSGVLGVVVVERWAPRLAGREASLNVFCALAVALATWAALDAGWQLRANLWLYTAILTFLAAVACTPRPVRRPMYIASLLVLAAGAWLRTPALGPAAVAMIGPVCVVVLCHELDRFTFARNRELYEEMRKAQQERERAEAVLYDVLPESIANELKRSHSVRAVGYEHMGVLFADIVGFTTFSRALPPDAVVLVLNQVFSAFDTLTVRHGVEKIKTIGDAYMVAVPYLDRLEALCDMGLAMIEAMDRYNEQTGTRLAVRVGIHVGPTVAGVIGIRRAVYDIWGDTVNVASRLEGAGAAGAVLVSEEVHRHMRDRFTFRARGATDIRGRGTMDTYWLEAAMPPANAPVPPQ